MKKSGFFKGLVVGILITVFLVSNLPALASNVEFLLNCVNISKGGQQVTIIGENFSLDNGSKVPFSIGYKGTIYLPVKKLSQILGHEVTWDGKTKTVLIDSNQPDPSDTSSATSSLPDTSSLADRAAYMPQYNNNEGYVIRVAANKSKGFNRPYYLYIPYSLVKNNGNHLMVETANVFVHDAEMTDLLTGKEVSQIDTARLSAATNSVLLLAAFERPKTGPDAYVYTHDYGRTSLLISPSSELYRLDLQLAAMIQDAKDILSCEGIAVKNKVFAYGYSASSHFMNRFAILHPELVQAIATGGINSLPVIPLKEYQGKKLRYPIGIDDLKSLTNIDFSLEIYKKIPQYIFMGADDTNDTAAAGDCFDPQDTQLIYELLGRNQVPDRFNKVKSIFDSLGVNATFKLYPGVGHWGMYGSIFDDVKTFYNNNKDTTPINIPKKIDNAFPVANIEDPYTKANVPEFEETPEYHRNNGMVVRVKAKPAEGFNRAYYMFIPFNLNPANKVHIIFETPNQFLNSKEMYYYLTGENITQCAASDVALSINAITVMPAIERPDSGILSGVYTHALTRQTMLINKSSELYRIDLQMEKTIEDAKEMLLKYKNITVEDKIYVCGFSASAQLATRYIMLHPEKIKAAVMGGITIPMQPYKSYNKQTLNYPLGINDFKSIAGYEPNLEAYKKIPQLYYIGDRDFNDPAPYSDSFDPGYEQIIYNAFGKIQVPDRFSNAMKALQASGANVQYKIVPNTAHEGTKNMLSEIISFYQSSQ